MNPTAGALLILVFLVVSCALAGDLEEGSSQLVVVELQSRTAEQLIPMVLPQIRAEEVRISGSGGRLIVGGRPDRVAEILALIEALDQPPRQLSITVAAADRGDGEASRAPGEGTAVEEPKDAGGRSAYATRRRDLAAVPGGREDAARGLRTRSREDSRYYRRIPLLEGEWADLYAGPADDAGRYAVEVRAAQNLRVFTEVEDSDSRNRFSVRASLVGDQVTVEVAFVQDGSQRIGMARKRQRGIRTTVKGQLGQWLLVSPSAAAPRPEPHPQRALAAATRAKGPLPVWVRVDEMDP